MTFVGPEGSSAFDLLVVGDPHGDCRVRFVECNGRWGGTSIPMHLVDRLMGEKGSPQPARRREVAGGRAVGVGPRGTERSQRPPYRAQDFVHPDLVGVDFSDILARVGDALYDPATGRGRYIFYNVGPLAGSGKLDVIAIGQTQEDAEKALEEELPALLGLDSER